MLLAEYDYETDIAVQRAEEREIAFAEGIEQGFSDGIRQTAKLMKQEHCDINFIMRMTSLSEAEIDNL